MFQVDTEGLVLATFVHRVSRGVDPQLHTHLLVSNKVRCGDGRWRAVDGRELYAHQKPAGNLYQAALRAELAARLGVEWAPVDINGQADIVGVPEDLCRHFSSRRREIEVAAAVRMADAEARLGRSLTADERAEAYQVATLATRPAKGREAEATETLVERWMADAAAFGRSPEIWLDHAVGRAPAQLGLPLAATGDMVAEVVAELAEQRSTWGRTDALRLVARRLPPALVASAEEARAWIEAGADAVVADGHVVALAAPARAEVPDALCRRDGLPTTERHGRARYTTRATLALEAEVIELAGRGREAGVAVASQHAIEAAVVSAGLGEDQAAAVRRVCAGGEAVVCLVGPAGAGKTRSVGAARRAWEASGVPVRGLAVSAVAAGVLTEEAGLASDTLAKFLFENAKPVTDRQWRLRAGEAVVLDEASMVATSDLAALVAAVEQAQAKLALVGDHRQLGAVGAGGLFRLLVADTQAAELTDARRFVEPWEAAATLCLRRGDRTVVDEYERHGRLVGGSREEMVEAAFASWRRCREGGESVVVLAHDHGTVDALALRARAVRVAAGEVELGGVAVGTQVAGVGDEVVTTNNDRRLVTSLGAWVRNGDRRVVTQRRRDGSLVVEHADGRGRVVLPGDYVAEHVALSYAVTVHKAQGLTVDRGVVVVDEAASAELVYVGMTRGRLENQACLVLEAGDEHGWRRPPMPAEALADALGRSGAELSATEVLRGELERSEDLALLIPALVEARRLVNRGAGPNRHQELQERLEELLRADNVRNEAAQALQRAEEQLHKAQAAIEASRAELDALGDRAGLFRRRAHTGPSNRPSARLEPAWPESVASKRRPSGPGVRCRTSNPARSRPRGGSGSWRQRRPFGMRGWTSTPSRWPGWRTWPSGSPSGDVSWPWPPRSTHRPTSFASWAGHRSRTTPASAGWASRSPRELPGAGWGAAGWCDEHVGAPLSGRPTRRHRPGQIRVPRNKLRHDPAGARRRTPRRWTTGRTSIQSGGSDAWRHATLPHRRASCPPRRPPVVPARCPTGTLGRSCVWPATSRPSRPVRRCSGARGPDTRHSYGRERYGRSRRPGSHAHRRALRTRGTRPRAQGRSRPAPSEPAG